MDVPLTTALDIFKDQRVNKSLSVINNPLDLCQHQTVLYLEYWQHLYIPVLIRSIEVDFLCLLEDRDDLSLVLWVVLLELRGCAGNSHEGRQNHELKTNKIKLKMTCYKNDNIILNLGILRYK